MLNTNHIMTSVFIQSDTPNHWLPAQDWQYDLLIKNTSISSTTNKSNQYLAMSHRTQNFFGDAFPQLSQNDTDQSSLDTLIDKAISLLDEILTRTQSEVNQMESRMNVRFKPDSSTVFGSTHKDAPMTDSLSVVPTTVDPVPQLTQGDSSMMADPTVDPVPQLTQGDSSMMADPTVDPVPQLTQGDSLSVVPTTVDPVPQLTQGDSLSVVPTTVDPVPQLAQRDSLSVVPTTVDSVPQLAQRDSLSVVPTTVDSVPQLTQGDSSMMADPVVIPSVPQSSLLMKFFASAPVLPPVPFSMESLRTTIQPFLEISKHLQVSALRNHPKTDNLMMRLGKVLFQTRQMVQTPNDFRIWKQLMTAFFELVNVLTVDTRSGVICNLRTGTSRLYLVTPLSHDKVNKTYTHSKPFMLEADSVSMLKNLV